jgi:hypothetical protein
MIIWPLLASVLLMATTAPLQQTITPDAKTLRRSGNIEDRRGEPPIDYYTAPVASIPYPTPVTPLGIDAGALDLDRQLALNHLRNLYLRKGAAVTDETMGELAASDNYDPDQLAKERAIRFRSNASNMSVQPPSPVEPSDEPPLVNPPPVAPLDWIMGALATQDALPFYGQRPVDQHHAVAAATDARQSGMTPPLQMPAKGAYGLYEKVLAKEAAKAGDAFTAVLSGTAQAAGTEVVDTDPGATSVTVMGNYRSRQPPARSLQNEGRASSVSGYEPFVLDCSQ